LQPPAVRLIESAIKSVPLHPALLTRSATPRRASDALLAAGSQVALRARALKFAILTAARTGEVIGARWSEIDISTATWTIPAERMKGGREHRIPCDNGMKAICRTTLVAKSLNLGNASA
jgi:integrase